MPIERTPKDPKHPFTMVSNRLINDRNLSLQALGLMTYLLSKPDYHYFTTNDMISSHLNDRFSIRSIIKELLTAGYLFRKQFRLNGKFSSYYYQILECPIKTAPSPEFGFPTAVKPTAVKPTPVKPTAVNQTTANNKIVLKTIEDNTTTKPTKVVNTKKCSVSSIPENQKKEALRLFSSLNIMNYKNLLANYPISDILEYANWMVTQRIKANNPTGYLIQAIKKKFVIKVIPEAKKRVPGIHQYQCEKCLDIFGYDVKIPDFKLCNKCAERKF